MDTDGVKADALDELMENWDEATQGRTPKLILMVPYVQASIELIAGPARIPAV